MSFGFGITDLLTVTQLAWRCVQIAKEACGEYDELTRETNSLHLVLFELKSEVAKPESLLSLPEYDRKEELKGLFAGCDEVLRQINEILEKYNVLASDRPKFGSKLWKRIKFGNREVEDLDRLRQKIASHVQRIALSCTMVSMGSQGRMERMMRQKLPEVCVAVNSILAARRAKSSCHESSILTKYENDDRAVWKEFRRDLYQAGIDSSVIHNNMEIIQAYIKELGAQGALDIDDAGV